MSGKSYEIATDFRDWIAFFDMMSDESFDKKQKMLTVLQWFTNEIPNDISGAFNALTEFASCAGIKKTPENQGKSTDSETPVLSWLYDSEYVLAPYYKKDDHERLKAVLSDIKGRFILSYNDDKYIRELYRDFEVISVERSNNLSKGTCLYHERRCKKSNSK